jgi:sugar/nucleoside kinase (ribokinase family)
LIGSHQADLAVAEETAVDNTAGAGDAYGTAVTVSLLQGLTLGKLHQAAGKIAAFVCSQPKANPA